MVDTQDTIKILAILTVVVCLKYFFVIIGSGGKRKRAPEDGFQPSNVKQAAVGQSTPLLDDNKPNANSTAVDVDNDVSVVVAMTEEERWARIVQNDLENIPITITLMWISVLFGGDNLTNIVLASLFTFGRLTHTICYIYRLMPWRSFAWMFGIAGTIGFMVNIIYGAFRTDRIGVL
mmetsp:Transcript_24912/g.21794  ORF Transcript_24912/g.21794 Transcript_24912/m.21794 type:complete len:177 (+) Transcript_24912:30-560(+)